MIKLDEWQEKIVNLKGNIALRSGRQVGKSTAISVKAGEFATKNPNKTILIIAAVERQARLMFDKTLNYIYENHKNDIKKGAERPTKHKITLKNGSVIHCLPTGLTGYGIRGYTIDLLIADEAAFIPDEVWAAVTPMLAVTKGTIILLSTPFGKRGYFYECFSDPNYTTFHVNSEDCPRIPKSFLDQERKRMTKLQYAQEYLGEFLDELMQFFPTELINACMTEEEEPGSLLGYSYHMGVDVARYGGDENAFTIVKMKDKEHLKCVHCETTEKVAITETTSRMMFLDNKWHFNKVYIDDGGIGGALYDYLTDKYSRWKRILIGINNAKRSIERSSKRTTTLMKEDIYGNLKRLMEQGYIKLCKDDALKLSLTSVQFEYSEVGNRPRIKIFGKYTHLAEALVRAAYCVKAKGLNLWIV